MNFAPWRRRREILLIDIIIVAVIQLKTGARFVKSQFQAVSKHRYLKIVKNNQYKIFKSSKLAENYILTLFTSI